MSAENVSSDQISSDQISSDQVSSDRVSSDQVSSDQVSSDQISSDQISSETLSLDRRIFRLSPIIRITLLAFYTALTLPLPFLAKFSEAPISPQLLALGLGIGAVLLFGALSERVMVDGQGIQVTYPTWVERWLRKGWQLNWAEITALKPRSTGQGGIVYYFLNRSEQAYLLPMRIAGFAELVRLVEAKTGIDTRDVRPLAQPWMYLILLTLTLFLLAIDAWTILAVWEQSQSAFSISLAQLSA